MPDSDYVAILALLVSIVAAFFTNFMYRRELKNQGYQLAMSMFIDVDKVFIEYPDARPYFYDGSNPAAVEDLTMQNRVIAIAEMMLDICELVTDTRLGLKRGDEDSWNDWVLGCLASSPAMLTHLTENPDWHPRTSRLYRTHVAAC